MTDYNHTLMMKTIDHLKAQIATNFILIIFLVFIIIVLVWWVWNISEKLEGARLSIYMLENENNEKE